MKAGFTSRTQVDTPTTYKSHAIETGSVALPLWPIVPAIYSWVLAKQEAPFFPNGASLWPIKAQIPGQIMVRFCPSAVRESFWSERARVGVSSLQRERQRHTGNQEQIAERCCHIGLERTGCFSHFLFWVLVIRAASRTGLQQSVTEEEVLARHQMYVGQRALNTTFLKRQREAGGELLLHLRGQRLEEARQFYVT